MSTCVSILPNLVYRLPVGPVPEVRAKEIQADFLAYLIPGNKPSLLSQIAKQSTKSQCIVLFAHGGGYARGEAKMYLNYMERWVEVAAEIGLDIVFLSVEYRELSP
jgi:hypothetical protein